MVMTMAISTSVKPAIDIARDLRMPGNVLQLEEASRRDSGGKARLSPRIHVRAH